MNPLRLRCVVFRGLPKEVEEEVNKFLETAVVQIQRILQSESGDHVTVTIFYELALSDDS